MKKILLLSLLITSVLTAQSAPFNCDYSAYLFQYNDVYAVDLASGNSYEVASNVTEGNINATAYNPADGYIWGSLSTPQKSIVRIGKDFKTTTFYIDELPTNNRYVGDVSSNGVYYLKGGGTTYYAIDVNPESENYTKYIATKNLSKNISIHDWAFNAVDGKIYALEKNTNILYRIDAETGSVESLGIVPILSGLNYTYGAVYFDASGRFYVSANQTGTIYVIQSVQDLNGLNVIESNLFAFGPSSSQNDGARCPTAPVPQEICDNGIDDDGDGLIDCEDPSCSGYSGCPVLETSTASSANAGGLESNNRLSQQISKRNFNRVKTSYKFDIVTAKRFKKSKNYGKASAAKSNGFNLSDFMPLEVINEDAVIESSPSDLIGITNATEVYSVDYMKNDDAIASILLLKTDKGVYEHTKYICDRLLGAQLISVSTIEINEQQFIKSLIRNIDGSLEFVLSLSAKSINNNANFAIESHWNLDKYESNVGFYNFQIWSNNLDDLVKLGEEVVRLLDVQQPVTSYNNSTPPTVFVRTGTYKNGKLNLQVVNTNRSETVAFDGGLRATETETVEDVSTTINLTGDYISNIEVDAGNLFDIGFRIGDGVATPDDLFMSDGPWGYDDAAPSTTVTNYAVNETEDMFSIDEYAIERSINLEATTSDYIAAYRALTPKFNPIDLTAYNSFKLQAKGTGTLIIRLVKEGVNNWQTQYKTSITLTNDLEDYTLMFSDFESSNGAPFEANDITSIVFTMLADNGEQVTKKMSLNQLRFATSSTLSVASQEKTNGIATTAIPNPMQNQTTIHFTAEYAETLQLQVYNQVGRLVKSLEVDAKQGANQVTLQRGKLSSGLYFCTIKSTQGNYNTTKLLMD
ncbi:T9SS type A sorting domain-containing protein [Algibacter amylolyticus]|uniref:T9SS type A sorting domain-containing protein n=1 Tax=Algibacter amylolyticus TaxID=1608400 RepID=A0A5M7B4B0_9FLAO|nr:T9SS type A sorting domain-containing protein [Algibacter amylolyticus]KAA5822334.1 T9SS type A sorting domain-containing protein [Algibacter amylolyticus]MBB5269051.1 hypothetical protein [Algibacter amylolyticus]TSJ73484.1 T9SS type A sorting domain-containing protein [Algibacter amylolyticus]